MKLVATSSPTRTGERDRYKTKDLVHKYKRFKLIAIPVLLVLICSLVLNCLFYFNKI